MVYWLFDPCVGSFRRFVSFKSLFECYVLDLRLARSCGLFKDWACPFRDHSLKIISDFYFQSSGEVLLKSRYGEPRDLYRAAFRSGYMQRFFSGVKPGVLKKIRSR